MSGVPTSANDLGVNKTHIALGFIFGVVIVAINALELYFGAVNSSTGLLFVVAQNIGIAVANSFYVANLTLGASGLTEQTAPAKA